MFQVRDVAISGESSTEQLHIDEAVITAASISTTAASDDDSPITTHSTAIATGNSRGSRPPPVAIQNPSQAAWQWRYYQSLVYVTVMTAILYHWHTSRRSGRRERSSVQTCQIWSRWQSCWALSSTPALTQQYQSKWVLTSNQKLSSATATGVARGRDFFGNVPYNWLITHRRSVAKPGGCFQRRLFVTGKRRYLSYSAADFEVYRPAGATRCTDGG